ncbi:hypothetical protein [Prochlorococcus sp. MIT 0916]|uniref:hypothetical protein n=1 Tax=Prochlorococcus sp. MIT 0916 TaxID=3082521 RepID=UPI0039B3A7FE
MPSKSNTEHFIELANKRVPKALKALDLVGNLANKSNYTYTEEQVNQIQKVLKAKVVEICKKFDTQEDSAKQFILK